MALTTSDPYTMTPAEQSRYASLFPSYAQEGYIHGAAAVELFSKSGLDRGHLKEIWTMCDVPVDNKLDLMEFCVAMHLIVCVTKKGMAVPEGLPGSLRGLLEKRDGMNGQQQQQGQMGPMMGGQMQPGQQQPQATITPASPEGIPSPDKMGMYNLAQQGLPPPPVYGMQQQHQHPQMPQQQQMMGGGMGQQPGAMSYNQMGEQPTVQQHGAVGGENVDDAFAGLSNSPVEDVDEYSTVGGGSLVGGGEMSAMGGGMTSMQQHNTPTQQQQMQQQMNAAPTQQQQMPQPVRTPSIMHQQQHFAPASPKHVVKSHYEPASPAPTVQSRAHTYASPKPSRKDVQEDQEFNSELEKLRSAHQKLQAEVISLRARANLVSDEEAGAQSEMRQLAASIAELSMELTGLKDQVAESKAKLADSLVMLKAQKEKKE
jgi:hypothetical protein